MKTLAEHQLTAIHAVRIASRDSIEKEWTHRYALPYPYKLNMQGQIIDVETDSVAKDAPEDVREKAETLKYRMELKQAGQTEIFDFI